MLFEIGQSGGSIAGDDIENLVISAIYGGLTEGQQECRDIFDLRR